MSANPNSRLSRRDLLGGMAALTGGATLFGLLSEAEAQGKSPYGPFKMGIQSYSLRAFNVDDALKHTQTLGLKYWEAYGGAKGHVPLTTDPAQVSAMRAKLKAAGIKLEAHGVSGFGKDAAANRQIFAAAKMLGIKTLSADPAPEAYSQLDELVEEFGINIAIHNHGPGHRYDKLDSVVKAVEGRHKRFGVCVDTGHFLRSRENPVEVIQVLGKRVHGVHLKDVKDAKVFTVLGQGDLDVVGTLRALKELKFKGVMALEYEENPQNPMAEIEECLAAVREAVKKI